MCGCASSAGICGCTPSEKKLASIARMMNSKNLFSCTGRVVKIWVVLLAQLKIKAGMKNQVKHTVVVSTSAET